MIELAETVAAWGTPAFENAFKEEVQALGVAALPLQQGLAQSSCVAPGAVNVVVLKAADAGDAIEVKAGVFYGGIISGSCCADDPTPVDEQLEYCELLFEIDKSTAQAVVRLLGS